MSLLIDGLRSHGYAIKSGHNHTVFACNQLIHLYSNHGLIKDACKLFDEMPDKNVFTWNAMISAHIKSNGLDQSELVFNAAPHKDSVTYNSILSGYANSEGYEQKAIDLFKQMQSDAQVDEFSLTRMCNLAAKLGNSWFGKHLHSFMVKTGNNLSGFAVSALVDMYSKNGCFDEAYNVFNGCSYGSADVVSKNAAIAACCRQGKLDMAMELFSNQPELNDVVSWNTMITGYAQNGFDKNAIELALCMEKNGFRWNEHTFTSVLNACSSLKCLKLGKELHARILKEMVNLHLNPFISSGIVDVYCKCGNMKYAESIHSRFGINNMFSATSMIIGYSSQQNMLQARRIFDSLKLKNLVVWSAMFSGYLSCNSCENVFELFHIFKHQEITVVPDDSIWSTLLGACAMQAIIDPGKQIHDRLLKTKIQTNVNIVSSLIDMYSKCGNIAYAQRIFKRLEVKDSIIYNVMMSGFAHHGYEEQAFDLFDEMVKDGFSPDNVTFIAILSACRHSGLVKTGEDYFKMMTEKYNLTPEINHYACMIDLYGKANELNEAMGFMRKIPVELDVVILGTFISACKLHKNLELARDFEDELLRIGGASGTRYVQLANVYASEARWDDMGRIRKKMRGNEVGKIAGCSWVHVGSHVHSFTSADEHRFENEELCGVLDLLLMEMNVKQEIQVQYAAGGVARNIAECVLKLGTKPYMISALGSDMPGNLLLEYWRSAGLPLKGIRMGHEIETPVVCIVFDTEGEPAAGVASVESLERFLTPEWIVQFKRNIATAPIVMVDANLSPLALKTSCQLAVEVGTPVWFEPVSVAKSKRIASVAKYVTFTSPNEDELISMANALSYKQKFTPIKKNSSTTISSLFLQLKPAIWVLLESGIKVIILTLGSNGVLLCSKGRFDLQRIGPTRNSSHDIGKKLHKTISQLCPSDRFFRASGHEERSSTSPCVIHLPAVQCASVVRLTGAGDCLVGGAVASICAGLDVMQSVAVGIAAAKGAVEVETNVPHDYALDQIAADARSVYLGAKVVFRESMM